MAKMIEITCACGCGRKKQVRMSDVKRGWGKYYSKSCKARVQEKRTNQYRSYLYFNNNSYDDLYPDEYGHPLESGPQGHGQE